MEYYNSEYGDVSQRSAPARESLDNSPFIRLHWFLYALFIGDFAPHLYDISSFFVADARPSRGSLFRIYRDTRFSADKRPFKTHVGIHFSHSSGKDAHAPVFYLQLEPAVLSLAFQRTQQGLPVRARIVE